MRLENTPLLDFSDVLIRPKRSTLTSRKKVNITRDFNYPCGQSACLIPIMAANMDGVGTIEIAKFLATQNLFTCLLKNYSAQQIIDFFESEDNCISNNVAMTIGINDTDYNKFLTVKTALKKRLKYICIDVANGYMERFIDYIKRLRDKFSNIIIIAGNVATADQTQELILNGVDIVKIGIGSGNVCTTRIVAGVGYPQLSAIIECADAAHGLGGMIIADGGCTCPGDIAKAFGGGADFVMLGSMLSGTNQSGGELITRYEASNEFIQQSLGTTQPVLITKKYMRFYGMSSNYANKKHFGGLKDYRTSEGREVLTPYQGDISVPIQNILGGLRSSMTYIGAQNLKDFSKCTTFIRCSKQFSSIYVR